MENVLKVGDIFLDLEVVRTSEKFCFFEDKTRLSWSKIKKLIEKGEIVQYKFSPNTIFDWSNKEEVLNYYSSFKLWNCYISNGSYRFKIYNGVLEVKDGLVFYNEEYYLPSPVSSINSWNSKSPLIEDGRYNVVLLKQENSWYPRVGGLSSVSEIGNIILNLFILGGKVKSSIKELSANSSELWAYNYNGDTGINFDYNKSTWDGLSFYLRDFDICTLYHKYFIKERWSDEVKVEISRNKLYEYLNEISGEVRSILNNALERRDFNISIDESYGEISISNGLEFSKTVSSKVFNLIENHVRNKEIF